MIEWMFLKALMLSTLIIHQSTDKYIKECIICHYWYFLDRAFKFQLLVLNGCHVLMMSDKT